VNSLVKNPNFDVGKAYELMYRARRVDEFIADAVKSGVIPLPVHLSIGQEAVSVGVCMGLQRDDIVFGTYRGHALYIAKGGNLKRMFAELWGKSSGCANGKGGSMHLIDVKAGVMGQSAIVGTGIPNATGYAFGMQYQKKKNIVVNFFGDGATEEGAFHESMNFAALKKLPIIYVCENNGYAISTHQTVRQSELSILARARSYGIETKLIEDNDSKAIFEAVVQAREDILSHGKGPVFLECTTYRWRQHLGPNEDFGPGGRDKTEAEPWMTNDELIRIGALLQQGEREAVERKVEQEIRAAAKFAEKSPYPTKADMYTAVFA
jgi:TPP-dependent pyruvate/acetoin dehydrogenase alpha subunit